MTAAAPELPASRKFPVCLLGAPLDYGNLGLRALAVSLLGLIQRLRPDAEFKAIYAYPEPGRRTVQLAEQRIELELINFRLTPRSKPSQQLLLNFLLAVLYRLLPLGAVRRNILARMPLLRALHEAEFIGNISGGDSFSDIYGLRRFVTNESLSLITLLLGKRLVLLPQTIGPFRTRRARSLARRILNGAQRIYARDQSSLELAAALLKTNRQERLGGLCPDVAFMLQPVQPEALELLPDLAPGGLNGFAPIGVNVSGLLFIGGYTGANMFGLKVDYREFTQQLIRRLLRETDAPIMIVPHNFGEQAESDFRACRAVWEALHHEAPRRLYLVTRSYSESEIKWVIGRCGFFIGARMHACIAALSQGVPSAAIAYSRKFAGVFDTIGAGNLVLNPRELDEAQLLDGVLQLYNNRAEHRRQLETRIPETQRRIEQVFAELLASEQSAVSSEQ